MLTICTQNSRIRKSGKFNFELCRFPVPTSWKLDSFASMLEGYHDQHIIEFLRFGWPVEVSTIKESLEIPPNQRGARECPEALLQYVSKELVQKSVIGPFVNNPFWQICSCFPHRCNSKKGPHGKNVSY